LLLDQLAKPLADHRVVIGYQDAEHGRPAAAFLFRAMPRDSVRMAPPSLRVSIVPVFAH